MPLTLGTLSVVLSVFMLRYIHGICTSVFVQIFPRIRQRGRFPGWRGVLQGAELLQGVLLNSSSWVFGDFLGYFSYPVLYKETGRPLVWRKDFGMGGL